MVLMLDNRELAALLWLGAGIDIGETTRIQEIGYFRSC